MKKKNGRKHDHSPDAAKPLLSQEALAALLDGGDQITVQALAALRPVIRSDPRLAEEIRALEGLAEEAGLGDGRQFETAVAANAELERLAGTEDWNHPAEILDPHQVAGISYRELVRLAESRVRQAASQGTDPHPYDKVLRKLQAAWDGQKARERLTEKIAKQLITFGSVDAARAMKLIVDRLSETFDYDAETATFQNRSV